MKSRYYRWWLARYPLYTRDTYESFEDFYDKLNPVNFEIDTRKKDEIMAELKGGE